MSEHGILQFNEPFKILHLRVIVDINLFITSIIMDVIA